MTDFISKRKAADAARDAVFHALQVGVLVGQKQPATAEMILKAKHMGGMGQALGVPQESSIIEGLLVVKQRLQNET